MRILGLDLSLTAPGVAILEDGALVTATTIKVPTALRGAARLALIETSILDNYGGEIVAIEGYSFGAKYSREAVAELGGVIRLGLYRRDIPYVEIPVLTWRKELLGKAPGPKDIALAKIMQKYGAQVGHYDFPTSDALEAWCVAYCLWLRTLADTTERG